MNEVLSINKIINQYANHIEDNCNNCINNNYLENGLSGNLLFLILKYSIDSKSIDREKLAINFKKIVKDSYQLNNFTFWKGTTGLGYFFDVLDRLEFLDADIQFILNKFDDGIIKHLSKEPFSSNLEETVFNGIYLANRLNSIGDNFKKNKIKVILVQICESIIKFIETFGVSIKKTNYSYIINLFYRLLKIDLYTEPILRTISVFKECIFSQTFDINNIVFINNIIAYSNLANILSSSAIKNNKYQNFIRKIIKKYNATTLLKKPVKSSDELLFIINILNCSISYNRNSILENFKHYIKIHSMEIFELRKNQNGLLGLSGISLILLSIHISSFKLINEILMIINYH